MPYAHDASHSAVTFAVRHMMISKVRGSFSQFAVDATFDAASLEKGSVTATIEVSWLSPRKVRELTVVGSRATTVYDEVDLARMRPVAVREKPPALEPQEPRRKPFAAPALRLAFSPAHFSSSARA